MPDNPASDKTASGKPTSSKPVPDSGHDYGVTRSRVRRAARSLSNSQIFLVFLVPGVVTAFEHLVYDGWAWISLWFVVLAFLIAGVLGLVNRGLQRRNQRRTDTEIESIPGYTDRRWPVVALTVGTNATSDGRATDDRVSPTPERLALTRLVDRGADHRVVMIHSPAARDAAENLAREEEMTEVVDYISVDPFGDVPSHAQLVAQAIRTAARKANISLASSAESQVVIDVTGGLLTMSLIGQFASDLLGCPTHVRATPSERIDGQTRFDLDGAHSIFLEPEMTAG